MQSDFVMTNVRQTLEIIIRNLASVPGCCCFSKITALSGSSRQEKWKCDEMLTFCIALISQIRRGLRYLEGIHREIMTWWTERLKIRLITRSRNCGRFRWRWADWARVFCSHGRGSRGLIRSAWVNDYFQLWLLNGRLQGNTRISFVCMAFDEIAIWFCWSSKKACIFHFSFHCGCASSENSRLLVRFCLFDKHHFWYPVTIYENLLGYSIWFWKPGIQTM